MKEYPFPNKEDSYQELLLDYVFPKIDPGQVEAIFEDAWTVGEEQGKFFLKELQEEECPDMLQIMRRKGLKVQIKDMDYVLGKRRYFCEYLSGRNLVTIYTGSVKLWCEKNGFSYDDGLNIILCHEYFHYLEWNKIGMVSRRHQVPMLKLGPLRLGRTGIPSLSEIAANAFAGVCYPRLMERVSNDNVTERLTGEET